MTDHKIVVTRDERGLARLAALRPVTEQDRADHHTWSVVCSDPAGCPGWVECREAHEVDGRSADPMTVVEGGSVRLTATPLHENTVRMEWGEIVRDENGKVVLTESDVATLPRSMVVDDLPEGVTVRAGEVWDADAWLYGEAGV